MKEINIKIEKASENCYIATVKELKGVVCEGASIEDVINEVNTTLEVLRLNPDLDLRMLDAY